MENIFETSEKVLSLFESLCDINKKSNNLAFDIFLRVVGNNIGFKDLSQRQHKNSLKKKVCSHKGSTLILYTPKEKINMQEFLLGLRDLFTAKGFTIDKLENKIIKKNYPEYLQSPAESIDCILGAVRYKNKACVFFVSMIDITKTDAEVAQKTNMTYAYPDALGPALLGRIHDYEYKG